MLAITSTAIAPFFAEDLSGDTQLAFPVLYSMIDRIAKVCLVIAKTFAGAKYWWVYLSCALVCVVADFILVYRWRPSPISAVNTVKLSVDAITAWAACCSFVAGSLPEPRENFAPFIVMVAGWLAIVLKSSGAVVGLFSLLRERSSAEGSRRRLSQLAQAEAGSLELKESTSSPV